MTMLTATDAWTLLAGHAFAHVQSLTMRGLNQNVGGTPTPAPRRYHVPVRTKNCTFERTV